ncbi:BMP family ABC transporter substrate-binding protein [Saccharibacillus sp. CPCC 101409]|uniref:BMP family lipoprotein n=1 Tax=Saccharibacillus sp. CPCC 101409 TaxID=3058041 RepID=UPI002672FCCA|nr:BMP family ABC transporter substrate-binding protein [Saccharibacillus sp. CPCC 101409]MDO3411913.1 BMP family ABC transporter substrate-binding protein [Saccharibacillus sp. CPCC 101409]
MNRKKMIRTMKNILPALSILLLAACGSQTGSSAKAAEPLEVGVVLSDVGLGDQSYSDAAFRGLVKARDEDGILFDYREIAQTDTYDEAFKQLVLQDNDLIIGLGYMVKDSLEAAAKTYPDRQFLIVDDTSDLSNVSSITFKEEEGSFLAGAAAAMSSKTGHIGFLGGVESDLLKKFEMGYEQGAQSIDPQIQLKAVYAGDFGKAELGASLAASMMQSDNVDVVYAAAGLTGIGALQEAQKLGKYAIGVDTDQFFIAEKAVITSMVKNVDTAIFTAVQTFEQSGGKFPEKNMVFGLKEDGVGLAPIHVVDLTDQQQKRLEELRGGLISGEIKIELP